ncbi:MAG: hypothetical protein ABI134_02015 [Byssovorax sp.]
MAKEPRISNQTAILLGSVIIAIGLYLGLRREPSAPPSPSVPVVVDAPRAPVAAPEPDRPAPAAAPRVERSEVVKQVEAALAKHKKVLVEKCLAPSLAKQPEPKTVSYVFNFTFDASGKQIARGTTESRENSRSDVTRCVNETLPPIEVPPPGQSMPLDVTFVLP